MWKFQKVLQNYVQKRFVCSCEWVWTQWWWVPKKGFTSTHQGFIQTLFFPPFSSCHRCSLYTAQNFKCSNRSPDQKFYAFLFISNNQIIVFRNQEGWVRTKMPVSDTLYIYIFDLLQDLMWLFISQFLTFNVYSPRESETLGIDCPAKG